MVRKRHHNLLIILIVAMVAIFSLFIIQGRSAGKAGEQTLPGGESATIALVVSDTQPQVGDTLTVTVVVNGANNLYGYQFDLLYSPIVLQFISVSKGSFLSADGSETFFSQPRITSGKAEYVAESRTSVLPSQGNAGQLAIFTFIVQASGISQLELQNAILSDHHAESISATVMDGSISAVQCMDIDHDAYGDFCDAGPDCQDGNAAINPGENEIPYDGVDNDCNVLTRENDLDTDGYNTPEDCADNNANVHPSQNEVLYDGVDNDCNSATGDNDVDNDGHTVPADCNDNNPTIYPGANEIPYDGIDNDCNEGDINDADNDGHTHLTDCNEANPLVHPGQAETPYDGVDNDCDQQTPDDDLDNDGYLSGNDCNDADAARNPDMAEIAYNGADENCNGEVDEGCAAEDTNHDRIVDIFDMVAVSTKFGATMGDANWNQGIDLKQDGIINIFDLVKIGQAFGMSC